MNPDEPAGESGEPPVRIGRIGRITTVVAVLVPIALLGLTLLAEGSRFHGALVRESGILEWAQVVALGVGAWALGSAALATTGRTRTAFAVATAGVVVVIGEEVAWGTHLIGSGIGFIESRNEQGDTTLHNLSGGLDASFAGLAMVALVLAGLVAVRWEPFREVPMAVVWWLLVPAAFAVYRLLAGDVAYHVAKISEAAELVFALAVAYLSLAARRRVAFTDRSTAGTGLEARGA